MATFLRRAGGHFRWMLRRAAGRAAPPFPRQAKPSQVFRFNIQQVQVEIPRSVLTPEVWATLVTGNYEVEEMRCLAAVLRPGDTMLELGAGIGFMSAFALRQCRAGRVVAVEANPALIPIIERTHALNGVAAEVIHGAVARNAGEVTFNLAPEFWSSSTDPIADGVPVTVRAVGLSGLLATVRPDVVMVDVEGAENTLFADTDLSGVRCVIVELHPHKVGLAGVAACFATLAASGLVYDPTPSRGAIVAFRSRLASP